jgi:exopolysaccharide biosynthesis polyprenyl glycosylphosphotransferase
VLRRYNQIFLGLCKAADLAIVAAAFFTAFFLRVKAPFLPDPPAEPNFAHHSWLGAAALVVFYGLIHSRGLYASRRAASRHEEARLMLSVSALGTTALAALTFFWHSAEISRLALLLFFALVSVGLVAERALIRSALQTARRLGYNKRAALIVGTGRLAREVHRRLQEHRELGFEVVGFVGKPSRSGLRPVLGPYEELSELVQRGNIDQVFVALDRNEPTDPLKHVESLYQTNASIRVVPDLLDLHTVRCSSEDFDGLPMICLVDRPIIGWAGVVKRAIDVVGASAALLICAPIMALIALAIRLSALHDPVFYRQQRVSLDGRVFTMLKFRTMVPDAEAETGPVRAEPDDPRRTVIGAILRSTSLDELPQLWNVLRGDMSLVGPRPERPELIEELRGRFPGYMLRHRVKGGLTGLAQINGCRGATPVDRRLRYDMDYASSWSLALDLKIMILTLFRVFRDPHAY